MESMVQRWKNKLAQQYPNQKSRQKQNNNYEYQQKNQYPSSSITHSLKKSLQKSRKKLNTSNNNHPYNLPHNLNNQEGVNLFDKKNQPLAKHQKQHENINNTTKERKLTVPTLSSHKKRAKSKVALATSLSKDILIQHTLNTMLNNLSQKLSQKVKNKIKGSLYQLWNVAIQVNNNSKSRQQNQIQNHQNLSHLPNSSDGVKQSTFSINSLNSPPNYNQSHSKNKHQRLYQDLQKKYFQTHKQKQYFKQKLDALIKKYQGVQKDLQRYSKMQRLIDNTIARQQYLKLQNQRLKGQIQMLQKRDKQQQKIFKKQICLVRDVVQALKGTLPKQ